jgi:hypothetical protein
MNLIYRKMFCYLSPGDCHGRVPPPEWPPWKIWEPDRPIPGDVIHKLGISLGSKWLRGD